MYNSLPRDTILDMPTPVNKENLPLIPPVSGETSPHSKPIPGAEHTGLKTVQRSKDLNRDLPSINLANLHKPLEESEYARLKTDSIGTDSKEIWRGRGYKDAYSLIVGESNHLEATLKKAEKAELPAKIDAIKSKLPVLEKKYEELEIIRVSRLSRLGYSKCMIVSLGACILASFLLPLSFPAAVAGLAIIVITIAIINPRILKKANEQCLVSGIPLEASKQLKQLKDKLLVRDN
jgi:hypothetical protein